LFPLLFFNSQNNHPSLFSALFFILFVALLFISRRRVSPPYLFPSWRGGERGYLTPIHVQGKVFGRLQGMTCLSFSLWWQGKVAGRSEGMACLSFSLWWQGKGVSLVLGKRKRKREKKIKKSPSSLPLPRRGRMRTMSFK